MVRTLSLYHKRALNFFEKRGYLSLSRVSLCFITRIFKTHFLQNLEGIGLTFGENLISYRKDFIYLGNTAYVIQNNKMKYIEDGFRWKFDYISRKLILHGKINDINDWK